MPRKRIKRIDCFDTLKDVEEDLREGNIFQSRMQAADCKRTARYAHMPDDDAVRISRIDVRQKICE